MIPGVPSHCLSSLFNLHDESTRPHFLHALSCLVILLCLVRMEDVLHKSQKFWHILKVRCHLDSSFLIFVIIKIDWKLGVTISFPHPSSLFLFFSFFLHWGGATAPIAPPPPPPRSPLAFKSHKLPLMLPPSRSITAPTNSPWQWSSTMTLLPDWTLLAVSIWHSESTRICLHLRKHKTNQCSLQHC